MCFFARVAEPEIIDRVGFYANDVRMLKDLGYEVEVATSWRSIPQEADVYFIWWWTWAFLPLIRAKLRRRPAVITGIFDYRRGPGGYFQRGLVQRAIMRWSLRLANANVLVSKQEFGALHRDFPLPSLYYSPLTVDIDSYSPGDEARRRTLVLTIAWLGAENAVRKCIPEIIEAVPLVLERFPDVTFQIVGAPGEASARLIQRAEELGVEGNIEWLGAVSDAEKIELLRTCGVYLQPSRYEGFGLAILEALSCGAPVVTSAAGEVPEVVGDAAVFCDGTSPAAIAEAVISVLDGTVDSGELGRRGRARTVSQFQPSRRRKDFVEIFEALGVDSDSSGEPV